MVAVVAVEEKDGKTIVTGRVTGDFLAALWICATTSRSPVGGSPGWRSIYERSDAALPRSNTIPSKSSHPDRHFSEEKAD